MILSYSLHLVCQLISQIIAKEKVKRQIKFQADGI